MAVSVPVPDGAKSYDAEEVKGRLHKSIRDLEFYGTIAQAIDAEEPFEIPGLANIHWQRESLVMRTLPAPGFAPRTMTIPIRDGFRPVYERVVFGEYEFIIVLESMVVIITRLANHDEPVIKCHSFGTGICYVYTNELEDVPYRIAENKKHISGQYNDRCPVEDNDKFILSDGRRIGFIAHETPCVEFVNGATRKIVYGEMPENHDVAGGTISFSTYVNDEERINGFSCVMLNGVLVPRDFEATVNADLIANRIHGVDAAELHRLALAEEQGAYASRIYIGTCLRPHPFIAAKTGIRLQDSMTIAVAASAAHDADVAARTIPHEDISAGFCAFPPNAHSQFIFRATDFDDSYDSYVTDGKILEYSEAEFYELPEWMHENGFTAAVEEADGSMKYYAYSYGSFLVNQDVDKEPNDFTLSCQIPRNPVYVTTDHLVIQLGQSMRAVTSSDEEFTVPITDWPKYCPHYFDFSDKGYIDDLVYDRSTKTVYVDLA